MVIADVDPTYSAEGWPRPQLLPTPLQLVAHLPIIESWGPKEKLAAEDPKCRCGRSQAVDSSWMEELATVMQIRPSPSRGPTTARHQQLEKMAEALVQLADAVKGSEWLQHRAAAFRAEHAANPQPWPPPAAVDWLWVDLGAPNGSVWPKIEVPPYTLLAGDR